MIYSGVMPPIMASTQSTGWMLSRGHFLLAGYKRKISTKPKDRWAERWIMASSTPKTAVYSWKVVKTMAMAATALPRKPPRMRKSDSLSNFFNIC